MPKNIEYQVALVRYDNDAASTLLVLGGFKDKTDQNGILTGIYYGAVISARKINLFNQCMIDFVIMLKFFKINQMYLQERKLEGKILIYHKVICVICNTSPINIIYFKQIPKR